MDNREIGLPSLFRDFGSVLGQMLWRLILLSPKKEKRKARMRGFFSNLFTVLEAFRDKTVEAKLLMQNYKTSDFVRQQLRLACVGVSEFFSTLNYKLI